MLKFQHDSRLSEVSYNNFLKFIIKAVTANPGATPLFHSDRGYQYTSKGFNEILVFLHQNFVEQKLGNVA